MILLSLEELKELIQMLEAKAADHPDKTFSICPSCKEVTSDYEGWCACAY